MGTASRDKGARWERRICQDVRGWLGFDWTVQRNPGDRQKGEGGQAGDLVISGPFTFPFCIEAKHYALWRNDMLARDGSALVRSFWKQTAEQAEAVGLVPLLVVKTDRAPAMAVMPLWALRRLNWDWVTEIRLRVSVADVGHDRLVAVPWLDLLDVDPIALLRDWSPSRRLVM